MKRSKKSSHLSFKSTVSLLTIALLILIVTILSAASLKQANTTSTRAAGNDLNASSSNSSITISQETEDKNAKITQGASQQNNTVNITFQNYNITPSIYLYEVYLTNGGQQFPYAYITPPHVNNYYLNCTPNNTYRANVEYRMPNGLYYLRYVNNIPCGSAVTFVIDDPNQPTPTPWTTAVRVTNSNVSPNFNLIAVQYGQQSITVGQTINVGVSRIFYPTCTEGSSYTAAIGYIPQGGTLQTMTSPQLTCGSTYHFFVTALSPTPRPPTPTRTMCQSPRTIFTGCGPNGNGYQSCIFTWDPGRQQCVRGSCGTCMF